MDVSLTSLRAVLLDPTPAWLAIALCLVAPAAIVTSAAFTPRSRRAAALAAVVALTLVVVLLARFVLLSAAGTTVDAALIRHGDNSGAFIDVEASYRDERGRTVTVRDEQPLVHVWYAQGSSEPKVSFVVLRAWPAVCQHGHRARLPQWRMVVVALITAALLTYHRRLRARALAPPQ